MDADALKTTLEALGDAVPIVPGQMKAVVDHARDTKVNADELLADFAETEGKAIELFGQIRQALDDLDKEMDESTRENQTAMEALDDTHEEWKKTADERREALDTAKAEAVKTMGEFSEAVKEGTEQITAAADDFKASLNTLGDKMGAAREKLDDAAETAKDECAEFGEAVDTVREELVEKTNEFMADLTARREASQDALKMTLDLFNTLGDAMSSDMSNILEDVVKSETNKILDEMKQKIAEELRNQVEEALGMVTGALKGLSDKANEAKENSSGARALLDPLFNEIGEVKEPIVKAIDSIRDAANTVGIDF